jgi:hypothetical protein
VSARDHARGPFATRTRALAAISGQHGERGLHQGSRWLHANLPNPINGRDNLADGTVQHDITGLPEDTALALLWAQDVINPHRRPGQRHNLSLHHHLLADAPLVRQNDEALTAIVVEIRHI